MENWPPLVPSLPQISGDVVTSPLWPGQPGTGLGKGNSAWEKGAPPSGGAAVTAQRAMPVLKHSLLSGPVGQHAVRGRLAAVYQAPPWAGAPGRGECFVCPPFIANLLCKHFTALSPWARTLQVSVEVSLQELVTNLGVCLPPTPPSEWTLCWDFRFTLEGQRLAHSRCSIVAPLKGMSPFYRRKTEGPKGPSRPAILFSRGSVEREPPLFCQREWS
nr:uncharacterized protein LOC131279541 isoform X2 [Dasypus novemcinctus]